MKAYELLFIVAPTIDDETRAGVMKRIETTITDAQGVVDNVDNWGSVNSLMRSTVCLMATTLSSISILTRRALPSSIACCASTMPLCVT